MRQHRVSFVLGRALTEGPPAPHGAVLTLSGYDVHAQRSASALFSDVHLVRSVVRPRQRGALADPVFEGGLRDDTVEVRFEEWLVAQLLGE